MRIACVSGFERGVISGEKNGSVVGKEANKLSLAMIWKKNGPSGFVNLLRARFDMQRCGSEVQVV